MTRSRIPSGLVAAVVAVSAAPILLTIAGVDFGVSIGKHPAGANPETLLHHALSGSFTHTMLEWSAFCTAIFTALLSLLHFHIKRDAATPIIGIAMLCAGSLDAFHILTADHVLITQTDHESLIPLTWAISRLFHVVILVVGATIVLLSWEEKDRKGSLPLVACSSVGFTLVGIGLMVLCARSTELPRAVFPDRLIVRPCDLPPLLLFLYAGLFTLNRFHQRLGTLFSHGLVVSIIPQVAAQLHMVFGAQALFDSHCIIAHLLKLVAYLVPLLGLALDYVQTYRAEALAVSRLEETQKDLHERSRDLERAVQDLVRRNTELDEFTYVASHDLQEPLRKLTAFSDLLRKDLGTALPERAGRDLEFIVDAAVRMQQLVQDLLKLSRAGRTALNRERVPLQQCVEQALDALAVAYTESEVALSIDPLPEVWGDRTMLTQLYQNLIGNALKFSRGKPPRIHLTAVCEGGRLVLGVKDNGIGIKPEYHEVIFAPFKRLHGRGEYEGTGIGLAVCRKTVERHGGEIWVESVPGEGAHFRFTLPEASGAGDGAALVSAAVARSRDASPDRLGGAAGSDCDATAPA
ncbi:MAG: ATP-binding protein [Planctomycetota bacterium]